MDGQGALKVDLEEHITVTVRLDQRCAVQVAEELGGLEESPGPSVGFKGGTVDEHVGIVWFARPLGPRGPRTAQPEVGVLADQALGDGSLADPAGTEQDERQWCPTGRAAPRRDVSFSERSRGAGLRAGCCPGPAAGDSR